jgi:hypothetical protein
MSNEVEAETIGDWAGHTPTSATVITARTIQQGLQALINRSGDNSRDHGFHEDWPLEPYPTRTDTGEPAPGVKPEQIAEHKRQVGLAVTQKLALIMEETIEAFGEIRSGRAVDEIYFVDKKGLIGPVGGEYGTQAYGTFVNGQVAAFNFDLTVREGDVPLLKPEGFLVEVADLFIRGADLVYLLGVSEFFNEALEAKHEYNRTRPYKHGRQF